MSLFKSKSQNNTGQRISFEAYSCLLSAGLKRRKSSASFLRALRKFKDIEGNYTMNERSTDFEDDQMKKVKI